MNKPRFIRLGLALSAAGLAASVALSPAAALASSSPQKTKHLSLSTVTLGMVTGSGNVSSYWTAITRGYYQKLGLTVNVVDATNGTSANNIAALVSNSWQFGIISPQSLIALAAQDPQARGLMVTNQGANDQLAINQTVAQNDHIPLTGTTPAGALKQLKALKGSHLKIAYSTLTSTSLDDMISVFQKYGITFSLNGSQSADVDLNAVGTSGALDAAVTSGKDEALINNPPISTLANTIVISFRQLYPVSRTTAFDLETTTAMIQQHPDTVQAMVTGSIEGMIYSAAHPKATNTLMFSKLSAIGFTNPQTDATIVSVDLSGRASSPLISKAGFAADLATANSAVAVPYNVSFNNFADNKFATVGIKAAGFKVKR